MSLEAYNNPKILHYLQAKHADLSNDYRTPDGKYSQACSLIAIEVAKTVLEIEGKPYLVSVKGVLLPDGINRDVLVPRIYQGRVRWGGHIICCAGDAALDPMIGKPLSLDEYKATVFLRPADIEVAISSDEIEEFIER